MCSKMFINVRFEVFKAANFKIMDFWVLSFSGQKIQAAGSFRTLLQMYQSHIQEDRNLYNNKTYVSNSQEHIEIYGKRKY